MRRVSLISAVLFLLILVFGLHLRNLSWRYSSIQTQQDLLTSSTISKIQDQYPNISRTLVVGYTKTEDISWVHRELYNIELALYSVDQPKAAVHIHSNKGHEAMVYLSYIIDHYHELSDVTLFFHAHQRAWHNDILFDQDSSKAILSMDLSRVQEVGYINSRCQWEPGCPSALHIDRPVSELDHVKRPEEQFLTSKLWRELHQVETAPKVIGQPCCAQFAVSREAILARPLSSYHHYRKWLETTELPDRISGRLFEHSWQFIFHNTTEYCPSELDCLFKNYGVLFASQSQLNNYKDKWRKRQSWWYRFWQNTASLSRELDEIKLEAYSRGRSEKHTEAHEDG